MRGNQEVVHEARFGFDRRTVAVLAGAGLFTAVLVVPGTGIAPVVRIAEVLRFGCGGLVTAARH